ncbi:zinc-dependent peptidase [Aureibaculum sp. 2210JD6-5]|uniref:zinc-dependent peptidase n=1 Tax=Aureibaculum sp. 2210JD6-5 TaxID=3103957 RepID=UPI002AADAD17|nr:zinc-dependent peptidase [Aureibaculum sp. 2210JD6-5]MDY7394508.1 zinc-dependent peptidase [Aureibaculum sp. 2210JD6-5]
MIELVSLVFGSTNLTRFVLFPNVMYGAQRAIIAENFSFYNNLSLIDKRYFEHRVLKFIDAHNFIGRDGVVVTKTMELLIASTAIMLTFGMRRYLFSQFENIVIYPKNYLSKVTNRRHQGETNPRLGTIVFSWDSFMDGIEIEDNNLNLGLHELTHAMHFSFLKEKSFTSVVFLDHFTALLNKMKDRKLQRKIVKSGYLREYAFRNQFEFLSVVVEHFFETPHEFNQKLPEVYKMVKRMLNLDTLKMASKPSA